MGRELELHGLDHNTRHKKANRPFEDVQGVKNRVPVQFKSEGHEKLVEKTAILNSARERRLREEPPTKARLTIREKKRNPVRSSISLADE
ncbi:hypothetical protein [Dyadobacter sp. CY356]|uniref:hypothetical protein n=1 Tax=Dyadobacter sp. CY356 TaxID=2906442 RepID=UPI001F363CA6|nr:hypothetical protein [Dyadobacter sp. CY356]MCF0058692.1 hypothetical protein [Dyadobacter sp. CY356]